MRNLTLLKQTNSQINKSLDQILLQNPQHILLLAISKWNITLDKN